MKREQIIKETFAEVNLTVHRGSEHLPTHREIIVAAAETALDLAGFSDENVPDSPRPVSNSPRETGKNSEFGPTELR